MKLGLFEIILIELVGFLLLWVIDEYTASLLCIVIPMICFGVLVIALIAEWIEPSKVPRLFFSTLAVSILIPLVSLVIYFVIFGSLGWLDLN